MVQMEVEPLSRDVTLSNGLNMCYYDWPGAGPNLVFLHPSSGYRQMWDATARALGDRFHVLALDQRGHGDTGRPDGTYAAEEYAEDLHLFLEALGLGRAILVGHSLGGRVAQVFAATHPEQAIAIGLVGGPHYSNFFQERDRVNAVLEGAENMRASRTEFPSREAALAYLREYRPADSEESRLHRIEHNTRDLPGGGVAFKYDNVRVAQGLAHMADNLGVYAGRVACPVAIFRGSHSTHLTPEEAGRIAAFWKDARVIDVEGDYGLEVENPQGLAQAILDFTRVAVPA
jgi:pimeloyl-ACP methyl ester carboxylesterase